MKTKVFQVYNSADDWRSMLMSWSHDQVQLFRVILEAEQLRGNNSLSSPSPAAVIPNIDS